MTTEKLRDAIADVLADENASPNIWKRADAILALPEMVALIKIEQAARAFRNEETEYNRDAATNTIVDVVMARKAVHRAVDAYDKAVKG